MKLGQVIKYKINIFPQKLCRAVRLVPNLFMFFKKALDEVKEGGLQLNFNIF